MIADNVLADESVPADNRTFASSARRAESFSESGRVEESSPWKIVGLSGTSVEAAALILSILTTAACINYQPRPSQIKTKGQSRRQMRDTYLNHCDKMLHARHHRRKNRHRQLPHEMRKPRNITPKMPSEHHLMIRLEIRLIQIFSTEGNTALTEGIIGNQVMCRCSVQQTHVHRHLLLLRRFQALQYLREHFVDHGL